MSMGLFTLEHERLAYDADFVLYGTAVLALAGALVTICPPAERREAFAVVLAGLAFWTLVEYGLHRFVLHGVQPFQRWHAEHHRRPAALIGLPTVGSAALFAGLVFLPAWLAGGWWPACALTLGMLLGYLGYALTHHAAHHILTRSGWLARRKRLHALHHHHVEHPVCFGVTSAFWDRIFGTDKVQRS
jgi:cyclopropane-fatty-acyl-phospholipid synthase